MASDIIQSVDRALEFLIYLYNEGKETSVTQIANDLGVYKSTVFSYTDNNGGKRIR